MTPEAATVFGILGVAAALFASGRVRLDVVALLVVLALMLTEVLTPREALSGFGDPVVLLVAGLLVVGETLTRTGVAYSISAWLSRVGGTSETRLLVLLMLASGVLGSVMSSTAVVAIFIPVVLTISAKAGLNASRLLMPLSFAALASGMLTLIATTPNLVVSAELASQGLEPFGFFSFTPIGLAVLLVATAYMWGVGRHLLPGAPNAPPRTQRRTLQDLRTGYGLDQKEHRLRVPAGSPLIGLTLHDARIGTRFHARVIGIERVGGVFVPSPGPDAEVHADDALLMVAHQPEADALTREFGLERRTLGEAELTKIQQFVGLAVVLVHPDSGLIGADLRSARFRTAHGLHVVGLRRRDTIVTDFVDEPLEPGDALLLIGAWDDIAQLQTESHDFVVLTLPAEYAEIAPARDRAPWALAILAGMVLLSAFEIVPVVVAVLIAGLAAVFTRCLTMEDGYRAVSWSSLVLIAGMLPIADALQKTGGTDLVVKLLIEELGYSTPYFVMSVIFFVTAGLGLVLSNTATAVLMAPIAIQAAQAIGVSPHPLAMTVAIAASAAFATPVSTPVVTLVVSPGGYRFLDFVKVGTPLMLLAWLTTLLVTPLFFPF